MNLDILNDCSYYDSLIKTLLNCSAKMPAASNLDEHSNSKEPVDKHWPSNNRRHLTNNYFQSQSLSLEEWA